MGYMSCMGDIAATTCGTRCNPFNSCNPNPVPTRLDIRLGAF
jgi:hypothetical protein